MPRGTFVLKDHAAHPLVMIAAGIGVTPIMSMIDSLARPQNTVKQQRVICIQVERSPEEHSMKDHIDQLVGDKLLEEAHVFYTRHSGEGADLQNTTIHTGRPTVDTLKKIIDDILRDAEFYFCGPGRFMEDLEHILDSLDVEKNRRHSEVFGPTT